MKIPVILFVILPLVAGGQNKIGPPSESGTGPGNEVTALADDDGSSVKVDSEIPGVLFKGRMFAGGQISFTSKSSPEDQTAPAHTTDLFSINPRVGYFLNEKWAVGLLGGYKLDESGISTSLGHAETFKEMSYSIGAFGRRLFLLSGNEKNAFYFSLDGSVVYSNITLNLTSTTPSSQEFKLTELTAAVSPLFIFFPTPRWGFEAGVGTVTYSKKQDTSGLDRDSGFSLDLGNVTLGVNYYFRH